MTELNQKYLSVIDGQAATWKQEVLQQNRLGSNFLVILPKGTAVTGQLCQLFELSPNRLSKPLRRSSLFLLSPHIHPQEFDRLLSAQEDGHGIVFIEQLDLPTTHPPRVKPYLVYCGIWGIISQHDRLHDAQQSWSDYLNRKNMQRPSPEAGIYEWGGEEWSSLEI